MSQSGRMLENKSVFLNVTHVKYHYESVCDLIK